MNQQPPEVHVPLVRDWASPAIESWTKAMYGRRSTFFAFGWLFWLALVLIAIKFTIYAGVVLAICAVFLLGIPVDLATYRARYERAAIEAWATYLAIPYREGGAGSSAG